MPKENNKMQVDIDTLKKQNVNDLLSIKEIYKRIEELGEKITQIKYIDNTLVKKLKKEYEKLQNIILDENIQLQLDNKIGNVQVQLDKKIDKVNIKLNNLKKKIIFASDFGILTENKDNSEGFIKLQEYLDKNRVDEILFDSNSKIYTNVNLKVKNVKLKGNNSTILPVDNSWIFNNQKALIVLDDNSTAEGFNFNGNYKNNSYMQDGKKYYSGASSTTALVKPIGVTGLWIIGDNCKAYNNTFVDLSWTCIDINGKAKKTGRNKNIEVYDNIFYNSAEDHIAIHNVDNVLIHDNYCNDASNHAIHPYSFTSNISIYNNVININSDNIIPWNETYIENSQRTAIILDHPQYPQSDVFNVIISNNIIKGNFKAAIELNGYTDRYNIKDNIFIGDDTNIGIRFKTITLGLSNIKNNKFKNLSKAFSINTISNISLPTYEVDIIGDVVIERNEYDNCNIAYEMFATADIKGIESFTFTCQENKFNNVSKHCNIQSLLSNFHLEMFDNIDMKKSTFNGNTLYTRNNTITTLKNPKNLLPSNFIIVEDKIIGFSSRAKVNTGYDTLISLNENNNICFNCSDGVAISYNYIDYKFFDNILCNSDLITLHTSFRCENLNNKLNIQLIVTDRKGTTIKSVTPITLTDYTDNEIYSQYNIFNLSDYNLNKEDGIIVFRFMFGDTKSYSKFNNFELLDLTVCDGINYNIIPSKNKIGYKTSLTLFSKEAIK